MGMGLLDFRLTENTLLSPSTVPLSNFTLDNLAAEPALIKGLDFVTGTVEWSPDSNYLAAGDVRRIQVWKMPKALVVQSWQVDVNGDGYYEPNGITWLDGGNKISWVFHGGRYMYDFQKNIKWWWTPRATDHTRGPLHVE